MRTKLCKGCGDEKSFDAFGEEPRVKDGKQAQCKDCVTDYHHLRYMKNRRSVIECSAKWAKENPERHAKNHCIATKKYRLNCT